MNDLIWALHAKTLAEMETKKATENKIELKKKVGKKRGMVSDTSLSFQVHHKTSQLK